MDDVDYVRGALTCCNFCAFLFALVAWTSFAWMWGFAETNIEINGVEILAPIFAGGSIVSGTARTIFLDENTTIPRQVIYWNRVSSSAACDPDSDIYLEWSGRYGFCRNGQFNIPHEVTNAEAFAIASVILLLVSAILSVTSFLKRRQGLLCLRVLVNAAAFGCVVGFVASISTSPWVQDLSNGNNGVLPFVNSNGELVPFSAQLRFGSAFVTYSFLIAVLIIINIFRVYLYFRTSDAAVLDSGVTFDDRHKQDQQNVIRAPRSLATV